MKAISKILMTTLMSLSFITGYAQMKNVKTVKAMVYGNCGMCENTIEKAGNLTKIAKVDWNKDTKIATISFDAKKTSQDEILKRIALAGYDSEKFLAPNDVYNKLHECCLYERNPLATKTTVAMTKVESTEHSGHKMADETKKENQLKAVFDNYFAVKDALVQTNEANASEKATALLKAINTVKMDELPMDVHMVWMKVLAELKQDAGKIADSKEVATQRSQFINLSKNVYALMKVSKTETPVYYQFCPMANGGKGANWLSKENAVKNPYYGSKMLGCGEVVETIN